MYRFRDTLPIDISEKTISGDLVTIENPEEMGVVGSLEVSLEPIQAGSGEPSPSNVRAISGRTEVVTRVAGKNLLPMTLASLKAVNTGATWSGNTYTRNGITFTVLTDSADNVTGIRANGTATAETTFYQINNTKLPLASGQYAFNGCPSGGSDTTYRMQLRNGSAWLGETGNGRTFTYDASTSGTDLVRIGILNGATCNNVVFKPMIRLATDTDATFEPYQGASWTTSLGRTVYGGTLDVVSGELIVNTAYRTFNGSENWEKINQGLRLAGGFGGKAYSTKDVSNMLTYATSDPTLYPNSYKFTVGGFINIGVPYTVAEWKSLLATTNLQVVYELATPQTYQLTPQQIDLLLGTNHLWSDGEISVVWHKDLTKGRILPTEAVSINGQYIENVLDGYRTLYTKGRESLGAELNTYSVGTADGEKFKSKRYPARELTVGFQLIGDNAEDFREKFNNLNNLLSLDEADFIFHDETDKFFSGYPIMDAEVEAGQNSVKGEWRIYCAYPFKRSVEPITLTMDDATVTNTTATWAIDYKGAQPARPILRAKFAGAESGGSSGEDGDCGFVAFMDARENIIQLGNPEVLDLDEYTKAGTLVNHEFINRNGWSVGGAMHNQGGAVTGTINIANIVDPFWNGGKGQTQSYAVPDYGDTGGRVSMHGPSLWKTTAGAVNFTLSAVHRLCVEKSSEYGKFELGAYNNSTGTLVAGFSIVKTRNGTTGTVKYYVNDEVVGTDKIDLSYNNTHFGYCKRSEVYTTQTYKEKAWVKVQVPIGRNKYQTKSQLQWVNKTRQVFKGYTYTQSNLNSSIQKAGAYVYFQVGNLPKRTFNVPDIEQMVAHDASCYMGAYKTAMNTNMVHSIVFRRQAVTAFAEQPNVFTAGDIVEADCNEATVNIYHAGSMGGHLEPQYGALGNDWENFLLTSGANVIQATWSDWVNPTYKPQIEIEYNEVFI